MISDSDDCNNKDNKEKPYMDISKMLLKFRHKTFKPKQETPVKKLTKVTHDETVAL